MLSSGKGSFYVNITPEDFANANQEHRTGIHDCLVATALHRQFPTARISCGFVSCGFNGKSYNISKRGQNMISAYVYGNPIPFGKIRFSPGWSSL